MSIDQDNDMWQRIEDAFTPNVDELRRAKKDLSRVRVVEWSGVGAGKEPAPRRLIRLATAAAILLLLAAGIGWIDNGTVYDKTYSQLAKTDVVIRALASPDTERSWVSSMIFATQEIKTGLYALHAMANSEADRPDVVAAAQLAWQRLREDKSTAIGDDNFNATEMLVSAINAETPAAEKLRVISNLEGLISRLIRAARTAIPAKPETKAMAVWKIRHWLVAPDKKAPKFEAPAPLGEPAALEKPAAVENLSTTGYQ